VLCLYSLGTSTGSGTGVGNGIIGETKYFHISGRHIDKSAAAAYFYAQYICMEYGKTHNNTLWYDQDNLRGYFEGDGYIGLSGAKYFIYWFVAYNENLNYILPQRYTIFEHNRYFKYVKANKNMFNGKINASADKNLWALLRNTEELIPSSSWLANNTVSRYDNNGYNYGISLLAEYDDPNDYAHLSYITYNEVMSLYGYNGFFDSYYTNLGYDTAL
jgi:hypothetical protein